MVVLGSKEHLNTEKLGNSVRINPRGVCGKNISYPEEVLNSGESIDHGDGRRFGH